jgi:2-polyprenyl-3-methyl-5-hydroxy-6-metoxy-1,4-benzoquinol methylase
MHISSFLRMEWFRDTYLGGAHLSGKIRILDVGSYNVNGSYKGLFSEERFSYIGLDMEEGPNVDICPKNPYSWEEIPSESFDVVISGQAFEHMEFFWLCMAEIARVVKKGGMVCIVAPRGFKRHRYPVDCYRFEADGLVGLAKYVRLKPLHASTNLAPVGAPAQWYSAGQEDSLLIAVKPPNWTGLVDISSYTCVPPDLDSLATGMVPQEQQKKK